jgi:hypothetical protein
MTIGLLPDAGARRLPDAGAGRLPDAVKPGIQCVRTPWIRGFMTFLRARARTDRDADGAGVEWWV